MKLYCLTNMYCQSTQAGIQAAHAAIRLVKEYENDTTSETHYSSMINSWYNSSEVMVVLNAGDHNSLMEYQTLLEEQEAVPHASFRESGLNNALTSIAVLCTEKMVDDMKIMRSGDAMAELQLMNDYDPNLYAVLKAMSTMRTI